MTDLAISRIFYDSLFGLCVQSYHICRACFYTGFTAYTPTYAFNTHTILFFLLPGAQWDNMSRAPTLSQSLLGGLIFLFVGIYLLALLYMTRIFSIACAISSGSGAWKERGSPVVGC